MWINVTFLVIYKYIKIHFKIIVIDKNIVSNNLFSLQFKMIAVINEIITYTTK